MANVRRESARFSVSELATLLRGADPEVFKRKVRPLLYKKAGGDPELVHEIVLETLSRHPGAVKLLTGLHRKHKELEIEINGKTIMPFGTAAGLDKDGDALAALSHAFGFMEPGTVFVNPRNGNPRPRVHADNTALDIYNAQGFPSKGLDHFASRLAAYRAAGHDAPVYVSVCGIPAQGEGAVRAAMGEMAMLLERLGRDADGFVWNPASPNTAALRLLRDPGVFRETAALMAARAPEKLRLVKLQPYERDEAKSVMRLVGHFMEGGGHGVVATNTMQFPRNELPVHHWGYPSAGRSGNFLRRYRSRSISDVRTAFPDAVIVGTGGIFDCADALHAFHSGANLVEGYTPYAFYGIGLVRKLQDEVSQWMKASGYQSMKEFQALVRDVVSS